MKPLLALLAALPLAAAPDPKAAAARLSDPGYEERQSFLLTFERTGCDAFETFIPASCPAYSLRLHGDGLLLYEGYTGVATRGEKVQRVPDAKVVAVMKALADAGLPALKDAYEAAPKEETRWHGDQVSHTRPWVKLGMRLAGYEKRVRHYTGDKSAPRALLALEKAIDELLDTKRWTD